MGGVRFQVWGSTEDGTQSATLAAEGWAGVGRGEVIPSRGRAFEGVTRGKKIENLHARRCVFMPSGTKNLP